MSNINDPTGMDLKPLKSVQGLRAAFENEGPLLANLKGKIIAVPDGMAQDRGHLYNVEKDEWVGQIPGLRQPKHDACCVGVGNTIFIYGGRFSMGRFRDIACLKVQFSDDG